MAEQKVVDLLLSAQKALLGAVIPSLRAIAVEWSGENIIVHFYHDGKLSDDIEDHYMCIGTEIVADFESAMIDEKIIRLDHPKLLPKHDHWIYHRSESSL
jgi:hypothetical protein